MIEIYGWVPMRFIEDERVLVLYTLTVRSPWYGIRTDDKS